MILISALFYAVSLALPAFLFRGHAPLSGLGVLEMGWIGVLVLNVAWYANVSWLIAVICFASGAIGPARFFSGVSILLSLQSFVTKGWWFDESGPTPIVRLGSGFYLWFGSLTVLFLGCVFSGPSGKVRKPVGASVPAPDTPD